jgi:hypothetical protein
MPGEIPFHIIGTIAKVPPGANMAYAKVENGNVYYLYPNTEGLEFSKLQEGQKVDLEVTRMLTRVLSAKILED